MLPKGFKSAGLFCGLKQSQKKDLGLIFSERPCKAAGVFTTNSVKAHCVIDNQETLKISSESLRAIIINSGNANACTGEAGLKALSEVKINTAKTLGISPELILTASTGIIGIPLPANLINAALPELTKKLSENHTDLAEAILTTDLVVKTCSREINGAKIVGVAKGSGMIHPNMATMLAFIMTDLDISSKDLENALKEANNQSFNQITVDGDTSTNDMVLVLANGASQKTIDTKVFQAALTEICQDLAKQIVRDGEGATKIFEVEVSGAKTQEEAKEMAKGIASSSLVKSAIFGCDPNWGRLLASAGQYGQVNLAESQVWIFDSQLLNGNSVCKFNKNELAELMKKEKEIKVKVIVGNNLENKGLAWGCDLTYDYIKINAEYTS